MAAIVVGVTLAAVLFGHFIAHSLKFFQLDAAPRAITVAMVSIGTTINSLLVAFVWDACNEAERTVAVEATCAKALARDVAAFESPEAALAFEALCGYLHVTVCQEWPIMQQALSLPNGALITNGAWDSKGPKAQMFLQMSASLSEVV